MEGLVGCFERRLEVGEGFCGKSWPCWRSRLTWPTCPTGRLSTRDHLSSIFKGIVTFWVAWIRTASCCVRCSKDAGAASRGRLKTKLKGADKPSRGASQIVALAVHRSNGLIGSLCKVSGSAIAVMDMQA